MSLNAIGVSNGSLLNSKKKSIITDDLNYFPLFRYKFEQNGIDTMGNYNTSTSGSIFMTDEIGSYALHLNTFNSRLTMPSFSFETNGNNILGQRR